MNRIVPTIAALLLTGVAVPGAFAQTDTPPPATATSTPASQIDPAAMAILEKSASTMLGLKSYRATCYVTTTFSANADGTPRPNRYEFATVVASRPNLLRYDMWYMSVPNKTASYAGWKRKTVAPDYVTVADGKTFWHKIGNYYLKRNGTTPNIYADCIAGGGFHTKTASRLAWLQYCAKSGGRVKSRVGTPEAVDGVSCDVIVSHLEMTNYKQDLRLYIGRDGIVRRQIETLNYDDKSSLTRDSLVRNIALNAPVKSPKTIFAYTPPKGAKVTDTDNLPKAKKTEDRTEPVLLAAGTPAPDFSATDASGAVVKLSDLRGKVVVVDFWASWCPPCVASMPHNQKVIKKLQDEGVPVVLLAVDNAEEKDAFAGWVKKHPEFDALRFVYADRKTSDISGKLYRVSGIPTQYIVDVDGKIRSSSVGFGGETDDMEKAIRAALTAKGE